MTHRDFQILLLYKKRKILTVDMIDSLKNQGNNNLCVCVYISMERYIYTLRKSDTHTLKHGQKDYILYKWLPLVGEGLEG